MTTSVMVIQWRTLVTGVALVIHCVSIFGQQSISQVRMLPAGSVVTTTGTLSCGSEFGQIKYMQDGEAGIALYSGDLSSTNTGDSIVVTGVLSKYRGELQLSPVISFQVISSGNQLIELHLENLEDFSASAFESRKVIFPCAGINSCEGTLTSGWYKLYDQWGNIARLWIAENHPVEGFPVLNRPVSIEGIWTRFEDQYQLLAQEISDASEGSCHYIAPPHLSYYEDIPVVSWNDVPEAITDVWIGEETYDTNISFGQLSGPVIIMPDFLLPGKLYKARLTQQDSTGEFFHSIPVLFSTPALSSAPIEILFNRQVDASFSDGSAPLATGSSAIESDLIQRIDQVAATLDIAMYNTGRASIVQAISRAVQRGVEVRFIADDETTNTALAGQLTFPILYRSGDGIMHDKFIIADADDPDKAWLWTGSTNLTANQLSSDPNHAYILHDQAMALNYRIEFDEMWGQVADHSDARYGDFKTNNTAHLFQVGDAIIESYFSPSDETNCQLIHALQSVNHQALIGLLLLTRDDIVDQIIALDQQGADVRVILEDEESSVTAIARLRQAGVPVVTHDPSPLFHHKYAILDEGFPESDPMVITGSHNWTWSADNINDENTLIFHDQRITNIFRQEFEARWGELNPTSVITTEHSGIRVFPNPASTFIRIEYPFASPCTVLVSNVNGQIVLRKHFQADQPSVLTLDKSLPTGVYMVRIVSATQPASVFTIVIQ